MCVRCCQCSINSFDWLANSASWSDQAVRRRNRVIHRRIVAVRLGTHFTDTARRTYSSRSSGGSPHSVVASNIAQLIFEREIRDCTRNMGNDRDCRSNCGPLVGGWITDRYSWPWIFYVNVPIGLFAAGVTWMIYRTRETPIKRLQFDAVGLGLLITWVASLQVMLDKGKDLDSFSSPVIVILGISSLISFAFFLVWELTEKNPIVDLRLFA